MNEGIKQAFWDAYQAFGADIALFAFEQAVITQQHALKSNLTQDEALLLSFLKNLPLGN